MKRRVRKSGIMRAGYAVILCMLSFLFASCAGEEGVLQDEAGYFTQESEGVAVTLTTDKSVYQAGEEIRFSLKVENTREHYFLTQILMDYSTISEGLKPTTDTKLPDHLSPLHYGESVELSGAFVGDADSFAKAGNVWFGGLADEFRPIHAQAAGAVEQTAIRPYVQLKYGSQDVMLRFIINLSLTQETEEVALENRVNYQTVSCHDPSIFKDKDGTYYVFGTHMGLARSYDLTNWEDMTGSFRESFTQETIAQIRAYNRDEGAGEWWAYLWAPDVIYNPAMDKYCMYLSANGDDWVSNIVLLTADSATGPYSYAGSVVYGGFTDENVSATDVLKVCGSSHVPERYITNGIANRKWGDEYPNCIDPCVFYDEEGRLWMSYGSWSGGIFLLKLDAESGLRDYGVSYETNEHSDAYFGTKIAGGKYVSGEGSYIQHIGDYYYLFISYGNLEAKGGYNIRVFRSIGVDGDYVDALGNSPLYDSYVFNYNESVGVRLFGGYQWRTQSVAQVAQGHNSAFVDDDGRAFIVYHTRTNNGSEGHYVKVHQLFVNEDGWLVAAPYVTNGERAGGTDINAEDIAGDYEVILHRMELDYANYGVNVPEDISLNADGSVDGAYQGKWELKDGGNITLSLNGESYHGVCFWQDIEGTNIKSLVFSTLGEDKELTLWGSKKAE